MRFCNATNPSFDSANIVQYGFSYGWESNPSLWGSFWQSGSLYTGTGPYTAAAPDAWKAAWEWVYTGMWGTQPYIPNSNSGYLNNSAAFADGKLAMLENPSWYLCCIGNLPANGGTFQFGAMPSYNSQVAGRVDADTFRILQSSTHHDQAFTVLAYLVSPANNQAVDKLIPVYGAVSAITAKQPDFITKEATIFPFVTTDSWNVLVAGLNYPDVPSGEGWVPNYSTSTDYLSTFSNEIGNTPTSCLNITNAITTVEADLQSIFNTNAPLPTPTVLSIARGAVSPSAAAHVSFTVTSSQAVTAVDVGDFSLTTTGITGASVTGLSGTGAIRLVNVSTGSGNGTIRLNLIDNGSIVGASYHALGGLGCGNGNFTTGQIYTMNKILTFNSAAAQDGWILESSETSSIGGTLNSTATTFNLGDNALRKQYRSLLSFSTTSLPDTAVITAVTLKVKKQGITGSGNPVEILQGFMVDVKKGFFGTAAGLQTADFQTAASKTVGPFSGTLLSGWYSIDITGAKAYINKLTANNGLTQIRLRFKLDDNNNAIANYLSLYSGNAAAAARPQLVITYYVP